MTGTSDRRRTIYAPPWRIDVTNRKGVRAPISATAIARTVVKSLEAANAPAPGSVTVVLTDDAELEELNVAHMGHQGPTDVLSFPMLEPDAFRGAPRAPHRSPGLLLRGRRTHVGDIAISVERALEQAVEGRGGHTGDIRWSPADELRLLVTHGTLHLCGWDHAEPSEEAAMRELERRLLG